jgi:hypothetical protein
MRISTDGAWGKPPRECEDLHPFLQWVLAVGSASIALWARHSLGARKQTFIKRLDRH